MSQPLSRRAADKREEAKMTPAKLTPNRSAYETGTQTWPSSDQEPDDEHQAVVGTRAVIYLRVSSAGQVNTDYDPEGISIPAQRASCLRKIEQMGLSVVGEYVEPGKSGTEMTKRVAFQQMLERIRVDKDVDYIVIYKLSRMARNRIDDAIVMADLRKRGVTLVSATESIDATPVGQLMHGILAAFNEYRSREDGADIAYKMGEKAKKGGTLGRAPIGYLNIIERVDGREVRSVVVDPERAPFIKLAFELYASGNKTMDDLITELTDRGLTTRATANRPSGPISISKLSQMFRDRYYLGEVSYKGQIYPGRHEALVSEELFDRVNELLDTRSVAGERRRVHHHYLKGSLFCGRCWREDRTIRRMIIQRAIGRRGNECYYSFCRGVQDKTCHARYANLDRVEDAVSEHYKTIRFSEEFITRMRDVMTDALDDSHVSQNLLKKQLASQLKALEAKEENLLDLAADGELPQGKIRQRIRDINTQRAKLETELNGVTENLSEGARYLQACLDLLTDPYALYQKASDEIRRQLNQAIFSKLWVMNDEITEHELQPALKELKTVEKHWLHGTSARSHVKDGRTNESATLAGGASWVVNPLGTCRRIRHAADLSC